MTTNPSQLTPPQAVWPVRASWLAAIGMGLVPVALTAVGFGAAQAAQASDRVTYLVTAAAVTVAAAIGLLVMRLAPPSLREFGFRAPVRVREALWLAPVAVGPVIVLVSAGWSAQAALVPGFVWLAAAAAVSEEVWFRGLVLSVLRPRGTRSAVVLQTVIFGVLHLANLAGGKSVTYAVLQLLFAALFGLVAAQLYAVTGSLWPAIGWHFAHDALSYLSGDELTTRSLVGLGVVVVILAGYAAYLWRRLPA